MSDGEGLSTSTNAEFTDGFNSPKGIFRDQGDGSISEVLTID